VLILGSTGTVNSFKNFTATSSRQYIKVKVVVGSGITGEDN